jgi:hypothetical protein
LSGKCWLAVQHQLGVILPDLGSKCVVLFLEPYKLGFQIANALLEAAHFRHHAGIGTADVAE